MSRNPTRRKGARRGAALLLVLWAIILMAMVVLGVAALVEQGARRTSAGELALQAQCLAQTGIALGFQPKLERDDALLHQHPEPDQTLEVRISGEDGRLNVNEILEAGHPEILSRLFRVWGVDPAEADEVTRAFAAWGMENSVGIPSSGPGTRTTRLPFRTLQQVSMVLGMKDIMRQHPNWQESITLWSDGRLNVNEASDDVLAAFFGVPLARATQFTRYRNGPDGLPGTADDHPVSDPKFFRDKLGLNEEDYNRVVYLTCFQDAMRRVTSSATVGKQKFAITAVGQVGRTPWQYFLWSED